MSPSFRAACAVLITSVLAGCPTPTGRHRGEFSGFDGGRYTGGLCPPAAAYGGSCYTRGDECDLATRCYGATVYELCSCASSGTWVCSATTCDDPGYDGGVYPYDTGYVGYDAPPDPSCPSMVSDGASCPPELGGVLCTGGPVSDCDGGTRASSCACITGTWTCNAPTCGG